MLKKKGALYCGPEERHKVKGGKEMTTMAWLRAVSVLCILGPGAALWRLGIIRDPATLRRIVLWAGPVCVKVAQWLSDRRVDFLASETIEALRPLRDRCEQHPWKYTEEILRGSEVPEGLIDNICEIPIASGSVAQVYRATLTKDPSVTVIVKVLHPNVRENLCEDLAALLFLLRLLPWCASVRLYDIIEGFTAQCDLTLEARNLKAFRIAFTGCDNIVTFPEPIFAAPDVLIETFVEGEPFDLFVSRRPDLAYDAITLRVAVYMKMAFVDNLLHGDMHEGNLLFSEAASNVAGGVRVSIVDAGIATSVTDGAALRSFAECMFGMRVEDLAGLFVELNANPAADTDGFTREVCAIRDDLEVDDTDAIKRYMDLILSSNDISVFGEREILKTKVGGGGGKGGEEKGEEKGGEGEDGIIVCPTTANITLLTTTILGALRRHDLLVPGDIIMIIISLVVVEGQSSRFMDTKTDHLFNDALIYCRKSGLVDMVQWLGYDPTIILELDKNARIQLPLPEPETP